MALYVTRPRRDEERIGRGFPSDMFMWQSSIAARFDVGFGIVRRLPSEQHGFFTMDHYKQI